jgi:hypothetical protein
MLKGMNLLPPLKRTTILLFLIVMLGSESGCVTAPSEARTASLPSQSSRSFTPETPAKKTSWFRDIVEQSLLAAAMLTSGSSR